MFLCKIWDRLYYVLWKQFFYQSNYTAYEFCKQITNIFEIASLIKDADKKNKFDVYIILFIYSIINKNLFCIDKSRKIPRKILIKTPYLLFQYISNRLSKSKNYNLTRKKRTILCSLTRCRPKFPNLGRLSIEIPFCDYKENHKLIRIKFNLRYSFEREIPHKRHLIHIVIFNKNANKVPN